MIMSNALKDKEIEKKDMVVGGEASSCPLNNTQKRKILDESFDEYLEQTPDKFISWLIF